MREASSSSPPSCISPLLMICTPSGMPEMSPGDDQHRGRPVQRPEQRRAEEEPEQGQTQDDRPAP